MKTVFVDDSYRFEIEILGDKVSINGNIVPLDAKNISNNHFHFLLDSKSFSAEIVKIDYKTKEATIKVNGNEYRAILKDEKDILLEKMGIEINEVPHVAELKAPMPGMVLDVFVKPGDQLSKGDKLLVLEAMKMENLIKSPSEFVIKSIEINKGDKVEKNQVLLTFE